MDGAGPFHRFRAVTIPLLSPVIFFNLLLGLIGAFQVFASAYIIRNGSGGPAGMTNFITLYLYKRGFSDGQMGYAVRDRLGAAGRRRDHRLHPLPHPEILGPLLGRQPMTTASFAEPALAIVENQVDDAATPQCPAPPGEAQDLADRRSGSSCCSPSPRSCSTRWSGCCSPRSSPTASSARTWACCPNNPTLENYAKVSEGIAGVPMRQFFLNSLIIAVGSVIGTVLSSALAAYAFARIQFKGLGILFAAMIGTLLLPFHVADHPAVHPVQQPRPGRHVHPAAAAEIPRHRSVLRVPARAVHPPDAPRHGRSRPHRRRRTPPDLLVDHPAADPARPDHLRDLRVHLGLERLPRAPAVPHQPGELPAPHRAAPLQRPVLHQRLRRHRHRILHRPPPGPAASSSSSSASSSTASPPRA